MACLAHGLTSPWLLLELAEAENAAALVARIPRPAEHRFEGAAIVASEVRDRLEVRLEAAHQPDDLDIALGFALQPPARSNPVQIAKQRLVGVGFALQRSGVRIPSAPPGSPRERRRF